MQDRPRCNQVSISELSPSPHVTLRHYSQIENGEKQSLFVLSAKLLMAPPFGFVAFISAIPNVYACAASPQRHLLSAATTFDNAVQISLNPQGVGVIGTTHSVLERFLLVLRAEIIKSLTGRATLHRFLDSDTISK